MIRCLSNLLDRFLDWLAPPIQITDVLTPNDLADIEADLDCFEPDDLWAAQHLSSAPLSGRNTGTTPSPVRPAGAQRVGGLFKFVRRRG